MTPESPRSGSSWVRLLRLIVSLLLLSGQSSEHPEADRGRCRRTLHDQLVAQFPGPCVDWPWRHRRAPAEPQRRPVERWPHRTGARQRRTPRAKPPWRPTDGADPGRCQGTNTAAASAAASNPAPTIRPEVHQLQGARDPRRVAPPSSSLFGSRCFEDALDHRGRRVERRQGSQLVTDHTSELELAATGRAPFEVTFDPLPFASVEIAIEVGFEHLLETGTVVELRAPPHGCPFRSVSLATSCAHDAREP